LSLFLFLFFSAILIFNYIKEQNIYKSNEAYNRLIINGMNKIDLNILKENNKNLYNIFIITNMIKNNNLDKSITTDNEILKDILDYHKALITNNIKDLNAYSLKQNASLKDLAVLAQAILFIKNDNVKEAKKVLRFISKNSPAYEFVKTIKHSIVIK
jgi:hypothetical protein